MKKIILILIVFAAAIGAVFLLKGKTNNQTEEPSSQATSTPQTETISNGVIGWSIPDGFGLAVTKEQILSINYIPQCDEGFDYCVYYTKNDLKNTNFGGAGVRIQKRKDLTNKTSCLYTLPEGRTDLKPTISNKQDYSTSVFYPLGDAGAGHYSNGKMYRIFVVESSDCMEIETRIGESQFANYPEGSITEFKQADREKIYKSFDALLNSIEISATSQKISLPTSAI